MKKKLLVLFSVVIFLSSCSYMNDDGTLKSAKSYKTIETDNFNFKLRNGIDYKNTALNTYELNFKNNAELNLFYNSVNICTPEVYNSYNKKELSDRCNNFKTDVLDIDGKEIAYFKSQAGDHTYSNYTYMTDHNAFYISFRNEDTEKNNICDALALEILESLEYTGESVSVTENEYIAVAPNNIWFCGSDTYTLSGNYTLAETVPQYKSSFRIELIKDGEFDNAREYAEYEYIQNISNGYTYISGVSEKDLFENTAYVQSYSSDSDNIYYVYFTEQNGLFYRICESVYEDDKDVKADMDNVLENISFKPVSAEVRDEINKVGFTDYISPSYSYSISNCYHAPNEDESQSYFRNATGNYIRIKEADYYYYDSEKEYTFQAGENIITVTINRDGLRQYVLNFDSEKNCLIIDTDIKNVEENKRMMQFFESIKFRN